MSGPLRVAVLVKQVPRFDEMELGPDGRLVRAGLDLELNPYCRRAISKGVELAGESGGRCTVITLGPPAAEDCLREAIAWGAGDAVLISDPAFAGSDTLATSRALAAALRRLGPFDLVIAGKNSVDADTGQVPAQVAALLDLPLAAGVRELEVQGRTLRARLEHDDGWVRVEVDMPAVITAAERLIEPAKVDPEGRALVDATQIARLSAADLGEGPWGQLRSPTVVGRVQHLAVERLRRRLDGDAATQVRDAVAILDDRGAFNPAEPEGGSVPPPSLAPYDAPTVLVVAEPGHDRTARELLGGAARLAGAAGVSVTAVTSEPTGATALRRYGADHVVQIDGATAAEDVAAALLRMHSGRPMWALLTPSTMWGREVASRFAALTGSGLVGDAVDLDVEDGRLLAWKPAFGGNLAAAITCSSPVQAATVRPGVLPLLCPRDAEPGRDGVISVDASQVARRRVRVLERHREDDVDALPAAEVVIGVGTGVPPDEYPRLDALRQALGADLAATRKVTDKGWMPHARQVGITGHSIAPRLYVALGMSGKFNHMVGVRGAGVILAVNSDPHAPVFDNCDAGIVADWREAVPLLVDELRRRSRAVA